jgi:hypothetical protein
VIDVAVHRARRDEIGAIVVDTKTVTEINELAAMLDDGWFADYNAAVAAAPKVKPPTEEAPTAKPPAKKKR